MKKKYEEPSFELTAFQFGRIMGDPGEGEELVHSSIINPGAGAGAGGGLE